VNFLFCGYRDWSETVFSHMKRKFNSDIFFSATSRNQLREYRRSNIKFDLIFFVGWSWIIDENFLFKNKCICIHPSPLPKYRGGSPIQHQIISGEKESRISAFLMTAELDAGPILSSSENFSLEGDLSDIFERISHHSIKCLSNIIERFKSDELSLSHQQEGESSIFKRRKPSQSEISLDDFSTYSAREIYDKIRCLQNPYPNAFIVCGDGNKLYLTGAHIDD